MQKVLKIKISDKLNKNKFSYFENIYQYIQLVSSDYLIFKQWQLETKNYDTSEVKEKYEQYKSFGLNTGLIQQIMRFVDNSIKSYISWCKKKHKLVKYPDKIQCPILLRNDYFHVNESDKTVDFKYWLRVFKKNFPLHSYKYFENQLKQAVKISDSKIIKKDNIFWLYLTIDKNIKLFNNSKSLGVDLGMQHPIVCSDGYIIGNGALIRHKKLEFNKKRASQQKTKTKITNKQLNWQKDYNHKISKLLINYCLSKNVDVLCLEDLKGINLSNKRFRKYAWAFKQLIEMIKYKAQENGIKVVSVNPAYTSQTCSCCGLKSKDNRKNRGKYECASCGTVIHADINAARNIQSFSGLNGVSESAPKSLNLEATISLG